MSYAFDITNINFGSNENFGGLNNTFIGGDIGASQGSLNQIYGGLANNYLAIDETNVIGSAQDQIYGGFTTNFDATVSSAPQTIQTDNNPILLHPKDQTIYYKVSGYNPNTSSYETWIISERIVPRPELFDPANSPPNRDLGIFYSPPSGNPLVEIKIIGRWIQ